MPKTLAAAVAAASMLVSGPLAAQEAPAAGPPAQAEPAERPKEAPATAAAAEPVCELHVWPTQHYVGINTGLLSGFGAIGAVADMAAHKDRVQTVKDLMRDYLGPEVQLAELNRVGLLQSLKLPDNYRVVIEEPTPFHEDTKTDPALKARVKAMNETIKANRRLSASQSPCYGELITTMIFYHKAMRYGSNLFTGWIYRDFADQPIARKVAVGAVKNPLEVFPPKTPDQVEPAKAELRDAYVKDYAEWLAKKHSAAAPPRAAR
jgi:hypothetical protein